MRVMAYKVFAFNLIGNEDILFGHRLYIVVCS